MLGRARWLLATGAVLCVAHGFLAIFWNYTGFAADSTRSWVLLAVLLLSGLLWFAGLKLPLPGSGRILGITLLMGLLMRACYFGGPAIHEADYFRYLWDGAVTARGLDPYAAAPSAALVQRVSRSLEIGRPAAGAAAGWPLADLADEAGSVFESIRYADFRTIYPPGAQLVFAAAHEIAPFSLDAWRGVVLAAELLTVGLLLQLLQLARLNRLGVLIYWWNPLLIVQFASAAHMDALLAPPLLGALWAGWRGRAYLGSVLLAVAASIKLWPVMLIPVVARRAGSTMRACLAGAIGIGSALLLASPQLRYLGESDNGLTIFSVHWERNALAFPLMADLIEWLWPGLPHGDALVRLLVVAIVSVSIVVALRTTETSLRDAARKFAIPIAGLLLLAPTGYPWYYAWLLPFLCFWPHPALLLLGVMMSLYYVGFALKPPDRPEAWPLWVRVIEFAPVWVGIALWRSKSARFLPIVPASVVKTQESSGPQR